MLEVEGLGLGIELLLGFYRAQGLGLRITSPKELQSSCKDFDYRFLKLKLFSGRRQNPRPEALLAKPLIQPEVSPRHPKPSTLAVTSTLETMKPLCESRFGRIFLLILLHPEPRSLISAIGTKPSSSAPTST